MLASNLVGSTQLGKMSFASAASLQNAKESCFQASASKTHSWAEDEMGIDNEDSRERLKKKKKLDRLPCSNLEVLSEVLKATYYNR